MVLMQRANELKWYLNENHKNLCDGFYRCCFFSKIVCCSGCSGLGEMLISMLSVAQTHSPIICHRCFSYTSASLRLNP